MADNKRKRESERGKESLPVTRKSNKGKKSSISPAKCTPGRRKGGRESKKERKGYEPTILLQGSRFTTTKP